MGKGNQPRIFGLVKETLGNLDDGLGSFLDQLPANNQTIPSETRTWEKITLETYTGSFEPQP